MNWLTNWLFGSEAPAKQATPPPKEDPQARYLRDTLAFAQQQHKGLRHKQNEHERWQQHYGSLHVKEITQLTGTDFEDYLSRLFKSHGYHVETTPKTGDYGADLILLKDKQRIAVQAKRWVGSVGVGAVQEALAGAWRITAVTVPGSSPQAITHRMRWNSPNNPMCNC